MEFANLRISYVIGNNNVLYIVVYCNAIPMLIPNVIHVRYVENVSLRQEENIYNTKHIYSPLCGIRRYMEAYEQKTIYMPK